MNTIDFQKIIFLCGLGLILLFGMFQDVAAFSQNKDNSLAVNPVEKSPAIERRNWAIEYPKLVPLGFVESPNDYNASGDFRQTRILLRDFLDALNLKFESFSVWTSFSSGPMVVHLNYSTELDAKTVVYVRFLSDVERKKNEDGFVSIVIRQETQADRSEMSRHLLRKGTVSSYDLRARHFQMIKPGEWIRGDIRIGEMVELFNYDIDQYKLERTSPGFYKLFIPGISSKISFQLPSFQTISSLKDLPLDTMTTITVTGATPASLFPAYPDLKPDLACTLLDAGFEYKEGGRFEKCGLTFGEAKAITRSHKPIEYGGKKLKELKPQREARSDLGQASIVFESWEVAPTWSDDTKVDVYVYIHPQMDDVVKGLLKKKP
ncbi:MAG TPA: hypothetical protein PLA90_13750 [Candidatus Sumerlaeota bacterium]|mgnify:CR=1 FL=1|nr:hypothetical protein [Candidatus Sumerlaeota bacterium]HPS02596.1 hypothetical protein [Candidatus Sumerlaeota bacterium]